MATQQLIVKQQDAEQFRWIAANSDGQSISRPEGGDMEECKRVAAYYNAAICLVVPGTEVVSRAVTVSAVEKKHLANTIPYRFEDECVGDVDNLHFSLGSALEDQVSTAYAARKRMGEWLKPFQDAGIEVTQVVPDYLLLPLVDDNWSMLWSADENLLMLREGQGTGFSLELPLALLALQDKVAEVDEAERRAANDVRKKNEGEEKADKFVEAKPVGLPPCIVLYAESESAAESLLAQLPEAIAARVQFQRQDEGHLLCRGLKEAGINLRQGGFRLALPWQKWWQEWQNIAWVFAAAVLLYIGIGYLDYRQLKGQDLSLRQEMQSIFREVQPNGAISDPQTQLRRIHENTVGGSSGGESVVAVMAVIGPAMAKVDNATLMGINYTERNGEFRLNLETDDFSEIEVIRAAIEAGGLSAELVSSNRRDQRISARLRVSRPGGKA